MDTVRHRITARWNCSDAITLVGGFSDLPAAIQDEARKQGSDGSDGSDASDINAVYHRVTIYFVRENLRSETKAEAVIFHDAYGHYGLTKLFGKRIPAEISRLRGRSASRRHRSSCRPGLPR